MNSLTAAATQEQFCLPATTSGTPLFINVNDRPRMQSMINDLLGRVGSITQGFVANEDLLGYGAPGTLFTNDARCPEYDFYLQDTWKARRNLTIDLELRYELRDLARARALETGPGASGAFWLDPKLANDLFVLPQPGQTAHKG